MKRIYSKKDPKKLLHIVSRFDDINNITYLTPEDQFLQVATFQMGREKTFKPHQHIWKDSPRDKVIAQESWLILRGSIKASLFDTDGTLLTTEIIRFGDCVITFEGGHTLDILEEDTVMYEFKTGPYTGIKNDKVFL